VGVGRGALHPRTAEAQYWMENEVHNEKTIRWLHRVMCCRSGVMNANVLIEYSPEMNPVTEGTISEDPTRDLPSSA